MSYSEIKKGFLPIDLDSMRPKGFLASMTELGQIENDKVTNKRGWKAVTSCPVCNSTASSTELEKFGTKILHCANCSLRYSGQVPNDTTDIYSDELYLTESLEITHSTREYRKVRFGQERIEVLKKHMPPGKSGKLLDIGCGTGWFLEVARDAGFEIHGQEIGKSYANWTAQYVKCPVYSVPVHEIPDAGTYDVITLFDLIEHITDPVSFIKQCVKLLAPGGLLFILTPNFDSLAISIMREHSSLVLPAEHVVYFTRQSITRLMNQCGLQLEYYATCGIDLGDLRSFYEWRHESQLADACTLLYNALQPVIDKAEAGNHLRVIARKN
jgi:2-polyprenyl-3-methyl-5-hydroxy-6-metoxy-1,4-benzoquinol methylase